MAAAVEGEKIRFRSLQPGRHVNLVWIGGEVDEGALLEREQRRPGITVVPVLRHGVEPGLAGGRVFDLDCGDRESVNRKQQVHGRVGGRVTRHLPGDGEPVLAVEPVQLVVEPVRGLEIGQAKRLAVELEAVTQHVERSLDLQFFHECLDQHLLQRLAVQLLHLRPKLRLGFRNERDHPRRKQRPLLVPLGKVATRPTALGDENVFDMGFEGGFGGLGGHGMRQEIRLSCFVY